MDADVFICIFQGCKKCQKQMRAVGYYKNQFLKKNTNYDYVANIKLKMTAPLYKGHFNWHVDVLAPEKETKKKNNIIFTFYFNYCF